MSKYGFSCVRQSIGRHSYVAIIDNGDKEAVIALVPFSQRHPPLKQPDVDLIVNSLNLVNQISEMPDAACIREETMWKVRDLAKSVASGQQENES